MFFVVADGHDLPALHVGGHLVALPEHRLLLDDRASPRFPSTDGRHWCLPKNHRDATNRQRNHPGARFPLHQDVEHPSGADRE